MNIKELDANKRIDHIKNSDIRKNQLKKAQIEHIKN